MNTENRTQQQIKALEEIALQVKMALLNDETPDGVRDCIRTIIINAATESTVLIADINDSIELSEKLPGIIENLDFDYGRGVLHSIHAIVQYDTTAFKDFYEQKLDEKADRQNERIESNDEIRLTPARACELAEWIINQSTGIYSADAEDDRQKQAFLILLSAIVYEEETTKRESILFDVTKKVFGYSSACDSAENRFIQKGFQHWRNGKWNVSSEETAA